MAEGELSASELAWAAYQARRREREAREAARTPPPIPTLGGRTLREHREALGLTRAELVARMGYTVTTASTAEDKEDLNDITIGRLRRYVRALGGDVEVKAVFPTAIRAELTKGFRRLDKGGAR